MSKIVKIVAVLLLIGGGIATAPTIALAQHRHHGGGHWHSGGWGGGFGLGLGLGLGLAAPYYGGYYAPGPYYYDDYYASSCGWVRVRWRDGTRHRVWRCW
jgi:hypothetical protein